MIEFEINGKKIEAVEGTMIIEAADAAGIYIPRFCYHRKLSIVANCRMCLVEVSNMRKPVPACATPITQDLKVLTMSESALEAQRAVMGFLLINHPLDCPVCDQGGECELQDLAVGFGRSYSYYNEAKRAVANEDIGPLIQTEMTRCIHCTRCVRFGEEVAGLRELGVTFRGEHSEIGTYVKHFMQSELSGNIIDLCPVGALVSKPALYTERAWELKEHPGIAPHDCVGSNVYINTRGYEYTKERTVMRVNPRDAQEINECWLSDRDRFSYEGLHHSDRVLKPRMKKNDTWVDVEWEYALLAIADRLHAILHHQAPDQIAALISPNSTVEESFLMQKFMRALGSNHIDHRLRDNDFSDQERAPAMPTLGLAIADMEHLNAVLLVGSKICSEQPLLGHRVNKAYQEGASVMAVNPVDYQFTFPISHKLIDADIVRKTAEIARALADLNDVTYAALSDAHPTKEAQLIAKTLKERDNSYVLLGNFAMQHIHAARLRELATIIAELSGSKVGVVTDGANAAGAWLAGAVPHRGVAGSILEGAVGLDAKSLLTTNPVRAYLLLNVEPECDTAYPEAALTALKNAGCVVAMTAFASDTMNDYADFMLPVTPFSETTGTFVNAEGRWQSFRAVSVPHGDSKPAWKVIHALANTMQCSGFTYDSSVAICDEVQQLVAVMPDDMTHAADILNVPAAVNELVYVGMPHPYRVDSLVRRARALQDCITDHDRAVRMNHKTAVSLSLQHETQVSVTTSKGVGTPLSLVIDEAVADQVVVLPAAFGLVKIGGAACS